MFTRRRSRINTDLFPKRAPKTQSFRGAEACSPGKVLRYFSLSPLSWVSESLRQDIGQFHSPWMKPCNLESFFFIKNISIMKNLTDFCKWWNPVWIRACLPCESWIWLEFSANRRGYLFPFQTNQFAWQLCLIWGLGRGRGSRVAIDYHDHNYVYNMKIMRARDFLALSKSVLVLLKQFGRFCSLKYSLANFSAFHIIYNKYLQNLFMRDIRENQAKWNSNSGEV